MRTLPECDEPPEEYYEELHRQRIHSKLMRLPPGHPDAGDLLDALEENIQEK